jgi:hypothetical protein
VDRVLPADVYAPLQSHAAADCALALLLRGGASLHLLAPSADAAELWLAGLTAALRAVRDAGGPARPRHEHRFAPEDVPRPPLLSPTPGTQTPALTTYSPRNASPSPYAGASPVPGAASPPLSSFSASDRPHVAVTLPPPAMMMPRAGPIHRLRVAAPSGGEALATSARIGPVSEAVTAAFSRARLGRGRELAALLRGEGGGVDPWVRDASGNTLQHTAAQNNSRPACKAVLRCTDFATTPPAELRMLDAQNADGNTALHFAFAYGYHALGEYLLSLGADECLLNTHGLCCYEGLQRASQSAGLPPTLQTAACAAGRARVAARRAYEEQRTARIEAAAAGGHSQAQAMLPPPPGAYPWHMYSPQGYPGYPPPPFAYPPPFGFPPPPSRERSKRRPRPGAGAAAAAALRSAQGRPDRSSESDEAPPPPSGRILSSSSEASAGSAGDPHRGWRGRGGGSARSSPQLQAATFSPSQRSAFSSPTPEAWGSGRSSVLDGYWAGGAEPPPAPLSPSTPVDAMARLALEAGGRIVSPPPASAEAAAVEARAQALSAAAAAWRLACEEALDAPQLWRLLAVTASLAAILTGGEEQPGSLLASALALSEQPQLMDVLATTLRDDEEAEPGAELSAVLARLPRLSALARQGADGGALEAACDRLVAQSAALPLQPPALGRALGALAAARRASAELLAMLSPGGEEPPQAVLLSAAGGAVRTLHGFAEALFHVQAPWGGTPETARGGKRPSSNSTLPERTPSRASSLRSAPGLRDG